MPRRARWRRRACAATSAGISPISRSAISFLARRRISPFCSSRPNSLYADLAEHFEDVVQKAHKSRIVIVSPSLLVMAVQVMQALVRDARVREQAHVIQIEVRRLVEDVVRLRQRFGKLGGHFGQVQEDVSGILISADKIAKSGERIDMLDFGKPDTGAEAQRPIPFGSVDKAAE